MRVVLLLFLVLTSCAQTRGWRMPENNELSQADAAAYAADSMTFRKDMPHRPDPKPWQFYFKHCSINGNEAFYSKTSYDCAGPYY